MNEPERGRLWELFDQAADLPAAEQRALLKAACPDDIALRAQVEQLLANDARLEAANESAFLKSPLVRPLSEPSGDTAPSYSAGGALLPSYLGRYRLIRLLGEGGMGTVYEAEQDSPRRTVALKVIRPGLASSALRTRFDHESQILGRLHHPGIAQVYEAGMAEGQPFFAMEFVRGLPLDEYARLRARSLPSRLELLARVCDAVQHAHDQGVIHRDLKPANILVDDAGQPKVLDFGVARATDGDLRTGAGLTQSGQLLGTLAYMSPEQVTADPDAIDHRADVYALGVILFELAAQRLPYQLENRSLAESARLILEEDAPRLGSLNPELRGDVETIVAKAMEKDRTRRYPSAAYLATDLRRWVAHEPIQARPTSALYHFRKFARRHRGLVGGLVATGMALVLGLIVTLLFAVGEARQRDQAEQNARTANQEKIEAQYQTYRASLAATSAALQNNDVADASRHLEAAPEAMRGWEWRHLRSRLDDSSAVIPLTDRGGFLIPGPDQLRVGVLTSDGLRLTDLDGGSPSTLPMHPERSDQISVTQTSRGLRVAAWGEKCKAFDLLDDAGKVLCRAETPENDTPATLVMSPNGARVGVTIDGNRTQLAVFDATSGKQTALCQKLDSAIWTVAISPDSTRLASGGEDRLVRLWDAATGKLLATCRGHTSKVLSTAFSPDGSRLVTAGSDGTVRQWDARTGGEVEPAYERHSGGVFTAVYSPDGEWVASGGGDRTIRVWRARGRQDVAILHGHTMRVLEVAFASGGRRLASLSHRSPIAGPGDGTIRVWDMDPQATLPVLRGHTGTVYPVAYSPDGRWLASGSWDGTVRLWDAATGESCATLSHPHVVWELAFGPDGTWLVTGCPDGDRLRIWDVARARVRREIPFPTNNLRSLTVSPDGTRVAARSDDPKSKRPRLTVCDIASGKTLLSTEGSSLAYSPDGRWLAALAVDEKEVLLLDARTHEMAAHFRGHENVVFKAVFSPDNRCLATCSRDHTVRLWQIDSGECRVLRGHTDEVYAVAFHPDGTRLATGGQDGTVWLWDLKRGQEVVRLPGHKGFVWSLAFSPYGATLASGSGDGTVRLWDTEPVKSRYQARSEAAALRPEAERWVEKLWSEKNDPAAVVTAIRSRRVPSEALRQAALRAVLRRAQATEAAPVNPQDWP